MKKIIPIFMMILIMLGACSDEKDPIVVTGVTLNVNTLELKEGETALLEVTVSPADADNKNVTWSSSNTSVATIDSQGKVNVVGVGTTIITVKTEDGGKTATCTVTVTAKEEPKPDPILVDGVSLDKVELALIEGETADLVATVTPEDADNKNVSWSSSDESIVTVDQNGEVTAIKEGTAIITVITEDGGKTATCTVTVTAKEEPEPDPIPVDGVTLDKTELALIEGETADLVATVTPEDADNKNVSWSSSDESIATVDQNGKVTAVKEGTAIITVTTEDGDKTAACIVTVIAYQEPDLVHVTGVSLNKNKLQLKEGTTEILNATITPANADDKSVIWSSSDSTVATINANGKITAVKVGTCVITVKTVDGDKTATCTVTVTGSVTLGSGTDISDWEDGSSHNGNATLQ